MTQQAVLYGVVKAMDGLRRTGLKTSQSIHCDRQTAANHTAGQIEGAKTQATPAMKAAKAMRVFSSRNRT